ncbi:MAG: HAMP domain-containing sensor histidine kinase [Candidatus Omnitrophota bacterium]|nr:HAMP domain-containing sensor histidine kinase [Candidatus Omnitrophota bacterium]
MRGKKADETGRDLDLVLQELKENPYKKFNIAFALMSVIPFLVFVYILAARLFTFDIFCGDIGVIVFISMIVSFLGFLAGYGILKSVMNKVIYYAAKAKSSDHAKSEFVALVSHELKNPIATIKMNLSNLRDGLLGDVNEKQKRAMGLVQNIIDRMAYLINDLLDLHKIESGFVEMRRRLCNIPEIMERQIKELEQLANRRSIKVTGFVSGTDLFLWADEDRLSRVINNLLGNAIKYTSEAGSVKVKVSRSDGFIRIEVEDTAPTIPPDNREKIFDKFKRLESKAEGTGLGLAIARNIVELHKGKIWAEAAGSETGNKFIVILPSDLRSKTR